MFRTSPSLRRGALPLLACLFLAGCSSDATDGPAATAPGSSTATVDTPAQAGSARTGSTGPGSPATPRQPPPSASASLRSASTAS